MNNILSFHLLSTTNKDRAAEDMIRMHLHYADLSIHETAYSAAHEIPASACEGATTNIVLGPEAVECMYNSLLAIRSYFAVHSSLKPSGLVGSSIMTWAQFCRCQVTVYRLSTHPAADWDREAVRNTVDLVRVLEIVRQTCKATSVDSGEPHEDDKWKRTEDIMATLIGWVSARLKPDDVKGSPLCGTSGPTNTALNTEPKIVSSHSSSGNYSPNASAP